MTGVAARTRVLLADEFVRDDLHELVRFEEWYLATVVDADVAANRPLEIVYRDADATFSLHYFEDHLIGLRYIIVVGEDVDDVVDVVRDELRTVDLPEALAMFGRAGTGEEVSLGIRRVAIAAGPDRDPAVVNAFSSAMDHEAAMVRGTAIFAMGYVEWPELVPLLRDAAANDSDQEIRADARLMLEGFRESGVPMPSDGDPPPASA